MPNPSTPADASSLAHLRGQTLLIKVGGSIQDDPAQINAVMADAAALAAAGARPVVVHGGGKAISAAMKDAGLTPRFVAGQRYTDEATLAIAERVLNLVVNAQIVAAIEAAGAHAIGLHSLATCVLFARRGTRSGKPGEAQLDLGLVGEVTRVNAPVLRGLCLQGIVPVIAPIALEDVGSDEQRATSDEERQAVSPTSLIAQGSSRPSPGKLNINADLAAGVIARALRPDRFVLVSDTAGVRTDPADPASAVASLSTARIDALIASGAIDGGMLPKIQACLAALSAGCRDITIIDGRQRGALVASLTGPTLPGTRITP